VLRPYTTLKLSLRLPPTLEVTGKGEFLKNLLETNVPYGAKVEVKVDAAMKGWNAPTLPDDLE